MCKVIEFLKLTFPFNGVIAIFKNDAHEIVSEKGWRVINKITTKQ